MTLTSWPSFSLSESINQLISGLVTLCGVYLGFRYALPRLRLERALDRRLALLEHMYSAVSLYVATVRQLAKSERQNAGAWIDREEHDALVHSSGEAARNVRIALEATPLHADDKMRDLARRVLVEFQKLEGRRLGKGANGVGNERRIEKMEASAAMLSEMAEEIASVVRDELGVQRRSVT